MVVGSLDSGHHTGARLEGPRREKRDLGHVFDELLPLGVFGAERDKG